MGFIEVLSNTDAYIFIHIRMYVTYMYTCIHSALVNKLVPCTTLLSGALAAWRLRFRLHK